MYYSLCIILSITGVNAMFIVAIYSIPFVLPCYSPYLKIYSALGGIYRLPKSLKISKKHKFPHKNYKYNIIPSYFETFNKLKSTDIVCFRQNMSEFRRLKASLSIFISIYPKYINHLKTV